MNGLLGKVWRAFITGFAGGAVMSLTSIFDQLSRGADLGGNWPKALLSGVILGGLTAAFRAVYAVLPLDNADKEVGLIKKPAAQTTAEGLAPTATDAAMVAAETPKVAAMAAKVAAEAAKAAAEAANAAARATADRQETPEQETPAKQETAVNEEPPAEEPPAPAADPSALAERVRSEREPASGLHGEDTTDSAREPSATR